MGFAADDVAAGVGEVLATEGLTATTVRDGERRVFAVGEVRIAIGPLPEDRRTLALFHPRCLLILSGEGPVADRLKHLIHMKFLRVTG